MKKFLKRFLLVLVILLLFLAAVIVSGIARARYGKIAPEFPAELQLADGAFAPGDDVRATGVLSLPADRRILKAEFHCGKGAIPVGGVTLKRQAWRWSHSLWQCSVQMRSVIAGMVGEGEVVIELSPEGGIGKTEYRTIPVPEFSSQIPASVKPGEALQLAGAVPEGSSLRQKKWLLWGGIAAALLLIALAIWLLRRRRSIQAARNVPPWEMAMGALESLRHDLTREGMIPASGFARLTDIVRNYLEARFRLPASRRTTPEFLDEIARKRTALPEAQKPFLQDFLTAADLIKFARAPSDASALEHAVERAEHLVRETTPQNQETEVK